MTLISMVSIGKQCVALDVVVPFSIEYARGADPQKQKAIEVALAAAKAA